MFAAATEQASTTPGANAAACSPSVGLRPLGPVGQVAPPGKGAHETGRARGGRGGRGGGRIPNWLPIALLTVSRSQNSKLEACCELSAMGARAKADEDGAPGRERCATERWLFQA